VNASNLEKLQARVVCRTVHRFQEAPVEQWIDAVQFEQVLERFPVTAKLFDCIQIIKSEHANERKKAEREAPIIVTYKLAKIIAK